jgi:hypothetical protein
VNLIKTILSNKYLQIFIALSFLSFFLYLALIPLGNYLNYCTNKEFLTWDPELRYIITLKLLENLRELNLFSIVFKFFDSPHWPSLRNIIEAIIFLFIDHNPITLTLISFAFYCLLPLSFLFISKKEKLNSPLFLFHFFIYLVILLQAESLWLYSFTGMLELQGAFLFTFTTYYLSKVYTNQEFLKDKNSKWIILINVFLLYQTKYPYGYMLVLFLVIFEAIFYLPSFLSLTKDYFKTFIKIYKKPFILLSILCLLALFLASALLKGKAKSYLIYSLLLSTIIDFLIFFFKRKSNPLTYRLEFIIKWAILPIVIWLFIHPDRFGSYSGQITHVETQGFNPGQEITKDLDYHLVFFTEFVWNAFQEFHIAYLILLSNLIIIIIGIIDFIRTRKISYSFFGSFICLMTFLELSLLTTNRLSRHTYHLYPTMVLSLLFFLETIYTIHPIRTFILSISIAIVSAFPFYLDPFHKLNSLEVCYTGYNRNDYKTPLWIESIAKEKLKTSIVLFNAVNPLHVNKADTEYLLYKLAHDSKLMMIVDPKKWESHLNNVSEVWFTGNDCNYPEKYQGMINQIQSTHNFQQKEIISSIDGCITILRKSNP